MGVKTYQAYTMAEALDVAKRDLGANAVVLETRSFKRGGLFGLGRRSVFELTATDADRAELSTAARPRRMPRMAREAYEKRTAKSEEAEPLERNRTRRLTQAMAETHKRKTPHALEHPAMPPEAMPPASSQEPPVPAAVARPGSRPSQVPRRFKVPSGSISPVAGVGGVLVGAKRQEEHTRPGGPSRPRVARRFILTPTDTEPPTVVAPAAVGEALSPAAVIQPPAARQRRLVDHKASGEMHQELAAIKLMVGRVLRRQASTRTLEQASMPSRLFGMYLELIGQDLSEELAERIIATVRSELSDGDFDDASVVREAVLRHLASFVPAADPLVGQRSPKNRPWTIALIGPTGVGKTTTLAKLAATFKLRHHRHVGLVTCDTYRIAAVDQLRTYANIIGVPLKIALTPSEMQQAVSALADCEMILIDTAGRGPNDAGRLDELSQCLAAVDPHEVHLVLSSTSSERVLLREARAFVELGADRIVMTKLDEAVSFGVLINVMQEVGKKLSYITTGQEVPNHIEVGEPRRMAELVLGAAV